MVILSIKQRYDQEVLPALKKELSCKNDLAVPKLEKVVLNIGAGAALKDKKVLDLMRENLRLITGQEPALTRAKKSIAGFKVRQGAVVGMKATLRGKRMFDFLDKLVNLVLPRVRDFRGIALKAIDEQGNLNIGFKEHTVFLEVDPNRVQDIHGLETAIVTTAQDFKTGEKLFRLLGFPLQTWEE